MSLVTDPLKPDRVFDHSPESEGLVRHWICPRDRALALKPVRGTPLPGNTSPTGYTLESVAEQSRDGATMYLACLYIRPKLLSLDPLTYGDPPTPTCLYEVARQVTRQNEDGLFGQRIFVGDAETVKADVAGALGLYEPWPGEEGVLWGSRLSETQIDHHLRPGVARVVAHYAPPGRNGTLNFLMRRHGKGILEGVYTARTERLAQEPGGDKRPFERVFHLVINDKKEMFRWKLIRGSPDVKVCGPVSLRLSVVLSSVPLGLLSAGIGKINAEAIPEFGALGGKNCLMLLPSRFRTLPGESRALVQFFIDHNPAGWDRAVVVEKQKLWVFQVPVWDDASNLTGYRDVEVWESLVEEDRSIGVAADLSWLGAYL